MVDGYACRPRSCFNKTLLGGAMAYLDSFGSGGRDGRDKGTKWTEKTTRKESRETTSKAADKDEWRCLFFRIFRFPFFFNACLYKPSREFSSSVSFRLFLFRHPCPRVLHDATRHTTHIIPILTLNNRNQLFAPAFQKKRERGNKNSQLGLICSASVSRLSALASSSI